MALSTTPILLLPEANAALTNNSSPYWCDAKVKVFRFNHTWIIDEFCNEQKVMSCPIFTSTDSNESKWSISLYPKLSPDIDITDYVAFFSKLVGCKKHTTIRAQFSMYILDEKKKERCISGTPVQLYDIGTTWEWHRYVRTDFLLWENNRLLPYKRLTLLLKLSIFEDLIIPPSSTAKITPIVVPNCHVYDDLGIFLETKKFSDVTLVAGKHEFQAHKIILAAHSTVFSGMFDHETTKRKRDRVDIIDIDKDVLEAVLKFIYTDKVANIDKIARRLLAAAAKYCLERLRIMCEKSLHERLEVKNSVNVLILADLHSADWLKTQAMNFIVEHAKEVVKSDGYNLLINPSRFSLFSQVFRALIAKNHIDPDESEST